MNNYAIKKLLNKYKKTEQCLLADIKLLKDADYAKVKLNLAKVMISDLEKLLNLNN